MNVESILQEFGVKVTKKVEYFEVLCPFHSDSHASGNIHQKTGLFNCWVCNKRAPLTAFLTKFSNLPIYQVKIKIGYKTDCKNPISPQEVESYHVDIWNHPTFLHELHQRGITDEIIRLRRYGVRNDGTEKRVTIPIYNDVGEIANLLTYIPGASERKFLNATGRDRSKTRLYPVDQLEYDQILVCGGPLKAAAAAHLLNKYDIGAISPTNSETQPWPNELSDRLIGKLIYVNSDIDKAGERSAELRCRALKPVAREIHKVVLTPEMVHNLPKGDLNDFIRIAGDKADEKLYQLLLESPEWTLIPGGEVQEELPQEKSFREAYSHENVGKKTKFTGVVASINFETYLAPASVEVKCGRNEKFCGICDVNSQQMLWQEGGISGTLMTIGTEHPAILALVNEKTEEHSKLYKQCFRIPMVCRQCIFQPKDTHSVTEVRLDEELEVTSREEPLTMRSAFIVNNISTVEQQTYNMVGRLYPSPKNQKATYLISSLEATQDALDLYQPSDLESLNIFRPPEWTMEAVEAKLDEIYADLEANVTKIYQRRDYHLAIDLTYHSVLNFQFGDSKIQNAYVETLVVGDTGQGKSETYKYLQLHYGLGHKVDCKNLTLAGLTVGLERGMKHFAVYGALPRNDRGLVILEELIGMHPKLFQALTEVRSSGYVQITKISSKIKRARVRLLAVTNPIEKRDIGSYTYGIESALGVIGTNQDLRRFDLVLILGKNDIDRKLLDEQKENPPVVPHQFTDDLCQKLILKAWKCEQIEFEDVRGIIQATSRLVDIFGEGPPVLDSNTSHLKVAKLAAALAARTFSYEGDKLVVRRCHVEVIERYLMRIYSSPSARLGDKSKAIKDSMLLRGREDLIAYLKSIANAADIMLKLSETDELTAKFLQELCGDFHTGVNLFARLIQSNAIMRIRGDKYVKTPDFVRLLAMTQFELPRPDYIKREQF